MVGVNCLRQRPSRFLPNTASLRSQTAGIYRSAATPCWINRRWSRDWRVLPIEPSATLEAAIATLADHRIGAVVVLGADRRVIGILSERDGSSPRAGFLRFML